MDIDYRISTSKAILVQRGFKDYLELDNGNFELLKDLKTMWENLELVKISQFQRRLLGATRSCNPLSTTCCFTGDGPNILA